MNLLEYQAKKLFSKFDLPVLNNWIFSEISEIERFVDSMQSDDDSWVIKCQIRSGGRGKSGGVTVVSSRKDILCFSKRWLKNKLVTCQTTVSGEIVSSILIEPAVKIVRELYFSVFIDKDSAQILCMASVEGGTEIEDVMHKSPDLIYKIIVDPFIGVYPYQGRILARQLGLNKIQIHQFSKIYVNTVQMLLKKDLTLVEINPLVITENSNLLCLDAKVTIDQNALFKHPDLLNLYDDSNTVNHAAVSFNMKSESNYIILEGNIGCMVNGAGLAMATMDLMKSLGGNPANFLDIGGDTDSQDIVSAFKMILKNKKVKAIFINIFGGIVCCNLVANSIITAVSESESAIPIVVRLEGNNSISGTNKLIKSNLNIFVNNDLVNAIKQVIRLVQ